MLPTQSSFLSRAKNQESTQGSSGQSCSSLFCSLGKSTQPLNLSSHRLKEHQPNNPQLFGKAGHFQHQLPQGTTTPHELWQDTKHNPILPQPGRAGTPRGMGVTVESINYAHVRPKSSSGRSCGGPWKANCLLSLRWCAAKGVCCVATTPNWCQGKSNGFVAFPVGKVPASPSC